MKFLLAANWKMNLTEQASIALGKTLQQKYPNLTKAEIWLTPSFTSIRSLKDSLTSSTIKVGAQNAHWEESGAFTGEISCPMLKDCKADYVIIGHSERRQYFAETEETAAKRAQAVLKNNLDLIFCVGETLEERESGKTEEILDKQLKLLPEIAKLNTSKETIVAYEPVWAIGTGKVASVQEIADTHAFIKSFWQTNSSLPVPRILYGGSVSADNVQAISNIDAVNGALIGGASNSIEKFGPLIDFFA